MPKLILTEEHEALVLHYMLLARQLNGLSGCLLHIIRMHTRAEQGGEKQRQLLKGYCLHAQADLADLIFQTKKICEILGLDFTETVKMGDARHEEKKREFVKRHPNDEWI
jgi:hypothetical protein